MEIMRAERGLKAAAIFEDVLPAIPIRETKIQYFFTVQLADAAGPHTEAVDEPGKFGERGNLQDANTALRAFRPGAIGSDRRALLARAAF